MNLTNMNNKKCVYVFALVIMIFLSTIFLNSFYWPYEEFSKRKLLVGFIIAFAVVAVPILVATRHRTYRVFEKILNYVINIMANMWNNKKKMIFFVLFNTLSALLSYVIMFVVCKHILHTENNLHLFYTVLTVNTIIVFIVFMWKSAARYPEKIFVVIALVLGLFSIGVTPDRVGVSWDDEIHYARTLEISNYLNGIMFEADEKNIAEYADNIYAYTGYDRISDIEYKKTLEDIYDAREWNGHQFSDFSIYSVSYIPGAIGLIFARGLGLSYTQVFNMGRLFNLMTYIFLIHMAIKRVKYGKCLIALTGLIPTSIFMATNYSYDPWVTGFTILGFSYFVAELQEDETMKLKNAVIMVGAIFLGCCPKATYFPLLFPLLFLPKKKFHNRKQKRQYYFMIVLAGLLLVGSYLLPILIGGAGTGDLRGGADVNSSEQIKYILSNPMEYSKILFAFTRDYIALGNSGAMLQRFAYVGNGYLYSTVSLILVVYAFLDRGEKERNYGYIKITSLVGCFAAIIVSATALYVGFTAVASDTVAGMQGRYLVPTIYPALYSLGIGGVSHKINKNAFVCVPMLLVSMTFIYNMLCFCVINY